MLCSSLLYHNVNQLFFFIFFSIIVYHWILTIPPCAIQLDLTVNPHILMISLSRLIICRQLCTDVLQLLPTHDSLIHSSNPWKQPKASSSCVSSQNDVIYLSSQNTNPGIILNRLLKLLTQHSLSYQTTSNSLTRLPGPSTPNIRLTSSDHRILFNPVIQLLCFIFGCFQTLLMSLVFFSFILRHLVMYLSLLLPSDTVFLKSDFHQFWKILHYIFEYCLSHIISHLYIWDSLGTRSTFSFLFS